MWEQTTKKSENQIIDAFKLWCWKRLSASPTQQTWVWTNSGGWWRTGKPGMLHFSPWVHKESDTTEWQNNHNEYTNELEVPFHCIHVSIQYPHCILSSLTASVDWWAPFLNGCPPQILELSMMEDRVHWHWY